MGILKIRPYPVKEETHYAIFRDEKIIAFCYDEFGAKAVFDDATRRAAEKP